MAKKTEKVNVVEDGIVETSTKEVTSTIKKRQFKDTDAIACISITAGQLGMIGIKSGINYTWAGRGDVTDVEYQDLVAAIRSGKKHINEPYFIIQDKEFLSQFPQVEKIYTSMYSFNDLKDVLRLKPDHMAKTIESLPNGARESIKNIASTMIVNGTLDSVKTIKKLDEIFNTNFMLMTELFE